MIRALESPGTSPERSGTSQDHLKAPSSHPRAVQDPPVQPPRRPVQPPRCHVVCLGSSSVCLGSNSVCPGNDSVCPGRICERPGEYTNHWSSIGNYCFCLQAFSQFGCNLDATLVPFWHRKPPENRSHDLPRLSKKPTIRSKTPPSRPQGTTITAKNKKVNC